MAEARGEMDEGVRKLEDFIAAMNAVRERLNDQADFDAVDEAVSETTELARQIDAEAWSDGVMTRCEEKQVEQDRQVEALAALHQSAAEQRLPPVEEQLEDGRRQLEATFDEAREKLDDQADDIHQGLEDLREALQDLGHDLDQAMSGLESAFGDLEEVAEETALIAEASAEFVIALVARLAAADREQNTRMLTLTLEALRDLKSELMEMLADKELAAKVQEAQKCANTWSMVFTIVATVVVVVVAIVVMIATFGTGGAPVVAAIAIILMSCQVLVAVTAKASDFAQVLEAGEIVAADLGSHLPQLPGVTEVVGKVNDLLKALNPFD
jgi:hypothetical protein